MPGLVISRRETVFGLARQPIVPCAPIGPEVSAASEAQTVASSESSGRRSFRFMKGRGSVGESARFEKRPGGFVGPLGRRRSGADINVFQRYLHQFADLLVAKRPRIPERGRFR